MQITTNITWCTYHHWQPPVIRIFSTIIIIPHIFSRHIRTFIFFFTCLCFFLKPRLWKLLKISTLLFFLHFPSLPCDRNESFSFLFFFYSAVLNFRIKRISYGNLVLVVVIGGGKKVKNKKRKISRECVDFHLCE